MLSAGQRKASLHVESDTTSIAAHLASQGGGLNRGTYEWRQPSNGTVRNERGKTVLCLGQTATSPPCLIA